MTTQEKLNLITRNLDEVLTEDELRHLIETNTPLKHYIGFELSGQLHIGSGLITMMKIKDFLEAGAQTIIWLADWHSWINDKLGGDMAVIQSVGVEYFKHAFKACMIAIGGEPEKLVFKTGTQEYTNNLDFWSTVIEVSKNTTLARIMRSVSIMGRKEGENIDFAKLIYPPMQAADIFFLKANLAHAGMDQRKAHIIARECALQLRVLPMKDATGKQIKPVALHHHLLLGLTPPPKWPMSKEEMQEAFSDMKMSKSKPNSAVFITDSEDEIRDKLNKAFCPEKEVNYNPVLDWTKHLIFPLRDNLAVKRPEKFGGDKIYRAYENLETDFKKGDLHPLDLKTAVAETIIDILRPVRDYFAQAEPRAKLDELKKVMSK